MTGNANMLRVVMGGTFDPIHIGHLRMAVELHEYLGGSALHLMPCHQPPHRGDTGATASQRLAMVADAIRGEPGLQLDERELRRTSPSYTSETLAQMRREYGTEKPLAVVMGTDSFNTLPRWHDWMKIPRLAHIIIVGRPGYELDPEEGARELLAERRVAESQRLHEQPGGLVLPVMLSLLDVSATDIRQRVAQGRSIRYLVPDVVRERIQAERIYA